MVNLVLLALGLLAIILVLVLLKIVFEAVAIALGGLTNIIIIPFQILFNRKNSKSDWWTYGEDPYLSTPSISTWAGGLWVFAWICTFFLLPSGMHEGLCMFWWVVTPAVFFAGMLSSEKALEHLGYWPYSKLVEYSLWKSPPSTKEEEIETKPPSDTRIKDDTRYYMAKADAQSRDFLRWLARRK